MAVHEPVRFVIEPAASAPAVTSWEGRNALALPESRVRAVNALLLDESPHLIVHELRELHEQLGTLVILIAKDPAGYELCLVSSETFDPSVRAATTYDEPDWDQRSEVLAAITGAPSAAQRDEL